MTKTWSKPIVILVAALLLPACEGEARGATGGDGGLGGESDGALAQDGTVRSDGSTPLPVADLCEGLLTDQQAHPMGALGKPGLLEAVTDPAFGTSIRRITDAGNGSVLKTMYSTIQAWNADESLLILYRRDSGHELYDGQSYAFLRSLDINPADLEQVYWHPTDPDVLYYVDGKTLIRYDVSSENKERYHTFTNCSDSVGGGDDSMYIAWNGDVLGLSCDGNGFGFRISTKEIGSAVPMDSFDTPQAAPSGQRFYGGGVVRDFDMNVERTLDLSNPYDHASLGQLRDGHDVYAGVAFDQGSKGSEVGALVVHDLTDGSWRVVVGPETGHPYPPGGVHLSAVAHRRPGWAVLSIVGDTAGQDVLDQELVLADMHPGGKVCRIAHHRARGKEGPLGYWAEPHPVISPSGTRILFSSDWGGGNAVDTYVVELPSHRR